MKIALLTNATQYAGPAALAGLLGDDWTVACHDRTFTNAAARDAFESDNPGAHTFPEADATLFVREAHKRFGTVDCLVSNDYPFETPPMTEIAGKLDHFETLVENLLLEPVRLVREVMPIMQAAGRGSIILVTSGAPMRKPDMGGPYGYTVSRAGANKLAEVLAVALAPMGIRVNAIAPFYLHSQTFFPTTIGPDDPQYKAMLDKVIPMGRFGRPDELSGLFALFAAPDTPFLSGQIVVFSGAAC